MIQWYEPGDALPVAGFASSSSGSASDSFSSMEELEGESFQNEWASSSFNSETAEIENGVGTGHASQSFAYSSSNGFQASDTSSVGGVFSGEGAGATTSTSASSFAIMADSGGRTTSQGGSSSGLSSSSSNSFETSLFISDTFDGTGGSHSVTSSSSASDSGSSLSTDSSSWSSSSSDTIDTASPWQTTSLSDVAITYATWTTTTLSTTVLRAQTVTAGAGTAVALGTASATVLWNIPSTSVKDERVKSVVPGAAWTEGFDTMTVVEAEECAQLYSGAAFGGILSFCDAWEPLARASYGNVYSVSVDTAGFTDGANESGITDTTFFNITPSTSAHPLGVVGGFAVLTPMPVPGYQPWSALGSDQAIYGTYTIHVAASVTDTDKIAARALGDIYVRGAVTQVVTKSANDTLEMHTALLTSITKSGAGAGGYGGADGDNTVEFSAGVYAISRYPDGDASVTTQVTFAGTFSTLIPNGEEWAIQSIPAYATITALDLPLTEISCHPTVTA